MLHSSSAESMEGNEDVWCDCATRDYLVIFSFSAAMNTALGLRILFGNFFGNNRYTYEKIIP